MLQFREKWNEKSQKRQCAKKVGKRGQNLSDNVIELRFVPFYLFTHAGAQYIRYLGRTDTLFIAHGEKELRSPGARTNYLRSSCSRRK